MRLIDLTGQQFGNLTVLRRDESRTGYGAWVCRCVCGKECSVRSEHLRRGDKTHCGCQSLSGVGQGMDGHSYSPQYQRWSYCKRKAKKLGLPFSLKLADIPEVPDECPVLGIALDKSKCTTNYHKSNDPIIAMIYPTKGFVSGNIQIVSWKAAQSASKRGEDLTGRQFGKLIVMSYVWPKGCRQGVWECICECGNSTYVPSTALLKGNTASCGCTRDAYRASGFNKTHGLSKTPRHRMWVAARKRSKKNGWECNLEFDTFPAIPEICPVLGIDIAPSIKKVEPGSPSLDRVDSSKGYTQDNIRIISHRANTLKSDATPVESLLLACDALRIMQAPQDLISDIEQYIHCLSRK